MSQETWTLYRSDELLADLVVTGDDELTVEVLPRDSMGFRRRRENDGRPQWLLDE